MFPIVIVVNDSHTYPHPNLASAWHCATYGAKGKCFVASRIPWESQHDSLQVLFKRSHKNMHGQQYQITRFIFPSSFWHALQKLTPSHLAHCSVSL